MLLNTNLQPSVEQEYWEAERGQGGWEVRQPELLWVRARSTSPSGRYSKTCCLMHTTSAAAAHSIMAVYLGPCCERVTLFTSVKTHVMGPTPIIPSDINPSFMLWLKPAPPGLTGRHAQLRLWQWISGTDGLSVSAPPALLFSTQAMARKGPNPPGILHPMGNAFSPS